MRKLLFVSCVAFMTACGDAPKEESTTVSGAADSTATATVIEYPYKLNEPYKNWQPGDQQHAVTVMNSLQAWENGDIAKSMEPFADSVEINFDNWAGTYSKDSLAKQFSAYRSSLASASVQMQDWESVIAQDKSEEWVTLWYKQITTDKKGKTDSMACVNDARIVNGKIAVLNEAVRRLPAKK